MVSCDSERVAEALCVFARVDFARTPTMVAWRDVRLRYKDIAHQAVQQPALYTAEATGLTGLTLRTHLVLLLGGLPVAEQRWRYNSGGGSVGGSTRPRWSPSSSSVTYTPNQVRALTPYRRTSSREVCSRSFATSSSAMPGTIGRVLLEVNDLLEAKGVSVWFSEKDILLGQPFMREIDRGLAKSRTGLVLITPALLERVNNRGVSDKELSELLARDQLIPVVHETTYEEVRKVSPLLGSRKGLNTAEDSMEAIATKIADWSSSRTWRLLVARSNLAPDRAVCAHSRDPRSDVADQLADECRTSPDGGQAWTPRGPREVAELSRTRSRRRRAAAPLAGISAGLCLERPARHTPARIRGAH